LTVSRQAVQWTNDYVSLLKLETAFKEALRLWDKGMAVVKACRKAKLHRSTFYKLLRRVMDGELEIEPELMEIATKIYEGTLARVPSIAAKERELDSGRIFNIISEYLEKNPGKVFDIVLKEADKRDYFLTTDNIAERVICGYIHDYLEERPEWVFDVVLKGGREKGLSSCVHRTS